MASIRWFLSSLLLLLFAVNVPAQTKSTAERLGYPAGSKLLILHADDLAVAHSVDTPVSRHSTQAPSLPPASWCLVPG